MNSPTPCPKCSGTGRYYRGGNCYSCRGKGYQTLQDAKSNYGHDLHVPIDGYSGASVSVTMAEGFTNDLIIHRCNESTTLLAMHKHGKVNDTLAHISCKFADGSVYDMLTPLTTDEQVLASESDYDTVWANSEPEDRHWDEDGGNMYEGD